MSYEIQDPGFNQAYDGSILVKSPDTSVNLTGLIGLTNYKITVSGVTVSDGPPIEMYLQTNEGGELGSIAIFYMCEVWLAGNSIKMYSTCYLNDTT